MSWNSKAEYKVTALTAVHEHTHALATAETSAKRNIILV